MLQLQERHCEGEILIETYNQSVVFVRQPVNSENRNERGNWVSQVADLIETRVRELWAKNWK
jgi:hypothetical protein